MLDTPDLKSYQAKYALITAAVREDYTDYEQKLNSLHLFDLVLSGKQKLVQKFIHQLEGDGEEMHEAIHPAALATCIYLARRNNHPRIAEAILSAIAEEERGDIMLMNIEAVASGLRG